MLVTCVALAAIPFRAPAEDTMEPSLRGEDRVISLPYGFWTESFGAAAAYVYAVNGYPQPQAGLLGTVDGGHDRIGRWGSSWVRTSDPSAASDCSSIPSCPSDISAMPMSTSTATRTSRTNAPAATIRTSDDFITGSGWDTLLPPALQVPAAHRQRARPGAARVQAERRSAHRRRQRRHRLESAQQRPDVPRAEAVLSHAEHRERRHRRGTEHQRTGVRRVLGQPRLPAQSVARQCAHPGADPRLGFRGQFDVVDQSQCRV